MPRMAEDLAAFETALLFRGTPETMYLLARRWELTNTRYLLGPTGYLDLLNSQLDPVRRRFRVVATFDVVPRRGPVAPRGGRCSGRR